MTDPTVIVPVSIAPVSYGPLPVVLFYGFAGLTLVSAAAVALSANIVRAAAALLFALIGIAGLYLLLHADFLAAVQLVVYVGGTLILMIFGIMLTSREAQGPDSGPSRAARRREIFWAGLAAFALGAPLVTAMLLAPWKTAAFAATTQPTVEDLGRSLLDKNQFLLPFELLSLLLLAVMIGAAYLAKSRRPLPH
ncbi:MAG TPA: NADH-quinone oxidoreductase subunit J [Phycisphaerae bacterium]|nr:NADH-quinone oxidoreductase subunit J [Phycisphaerae bacterium]